MLILLQFASNDTFPYCSVKYAVEAMTDGLRIEMMPQGVAVLSIQPGPIRTDFIGQGAEARSFESTSVGADGLGISTNTSELARLYEWRRVISARMFRSMVIANAQPVSYVTNAVVHALRSSRPKAHYLLGASAQIPVYLQNLLPRRLFDTMLTLHMKPPKAAE